MPSVRELGRADNWWGSKIAPVLAVSYSAALIYNVPAFATARSILLIVFVGICAGSYGHLVNDVFDIDVDRKAGKRNHMAAFRPWQRFALCALGIALGFAPALFIECSRLSLALLAVEYLLPTIYSIPPLRLKEHGALGVLCDSLGAHAIPCLYTASIMAHAAGKSSGPESFAGIAFPWVAAFWALCLGLVGIVTHEFQDRAGDIQAGVSTFATRRSFESVRWPVSAIYAAELCAFVLLAALLFPVAPLVAFAALLFSLAAASMVGRNWEEFRVYRDENSTYRWWQLSHPFYECYFPLAASLTCAWRYPALAPFPVIQVLLFANNYRGQLPELAALRQSSLEWLRAARIWMIWHGRMDIDQTARARVKLSLFPTPGTRVEIDRGGSDPWSIRIVRPGIALRVGAYYSVNLTIRADRPRRIMFGIWQDHAPWDALGLCEDSEISPRWIRITRTFAAPQDERQGYFGFWLGGDVGAVEVRRCSVRLARKHEIAIGSN